MNLQMKRELPTASELAAPMSGGPPLDRCQGDLRRTEQRTRDMCATAPTAGALPTPSGEVRFRRDGERLCVAHATPVMWFARHVLERTRVEPDVGLSFDGAHVTLHASNGRWVWKLTGRSWRGPDRPDTESLVLLEGIWPD